MLDKHIVGTRWQKLWYTWRSHRFPWRKTYFVGTSPLAIPSTSWDQRRGL